MNCNQDPITKKKKKEKKRTKNQFIMRETAVLNVTIRKSSDPLAWSMYQEEHRISDSFFKKKKKKGATSGNSLFLD